MARLVRGDVVVVPFPFSDLTQAKRRPALILAVLGGDDLILCQITSRDFQDHYAVSLDNADFQSGALRQQSNLRPNRVFTADRRIILYVAGHLTDEKTTEVVDRLVAILRR